MSGGGHIWFSFVSWLTTHPFELVVEIDVLFLFSFEDLILCRGGVAAWNEQ
jgi:hypothetical protein